MGRVIANPRSWLGRVMARYRAPIVSVVLIVVALLLVFIVARGLDSNSRVVAANAAAAQLTAAQMNALEWQAIASGELSPEMEATAAGLESRLSGYLSRLGPDAATARKTFAAYLPAIRDEFRYIKAGRISEARRADAERVDPAAEKLGIALGQVENDSRQTAEAADRLAFIMEIAATTAGFAVIALLHLRFTKSKRDLAAAEVEELMLREASKAKGDLVSVVSHDLRAPLTAVFGYLEILRNEKAGPLTDGQQRLLGIIQRNAERLLCIVNDLLFISRVENHRIVLVFKETNLEDAAAEAVQAQRPRAKAQEVDLDFEAVAVPPIKADRARVDTLIENLLTNAIKFTPAGGAVRVGVGPDGDRVALEVTDTGAGISPEDQQHLFERFFRSPEMSGTPGTGLGLAIVKTIADAHGATIGVRSMPGEGSTFRVSFPLSPPATATDAPLAADS